MNDLIFLDTETTGKGPDDRLLQIGFCYAVANPERLEFKTYSSESGQFSREAGLISPAVYAFEFKPDVPITFEAMAVHNITPEMVETKHRFADTNFLPMMKEASNVAIMVAHNAPFDLSIMDREGVRFHKWIDTLRVARHLIDSPNYQLQYLRYSLGLNKLISQPIASHDAGGDVVVLVYLFLYLYEWLKADNLDYSHDQLIQKMIELSREPVEIKTFSFGKYNGQTIESVSKLDAGYIEWLYNAESKKIESDQNKDLLHTLILWLSKSTT